MKYWNIVISGLVLGATAALYFILGPEEKDTLFYVNFLLTVALEGVVLSSIFVTEHKYSLQSMAVTGPVLGGVVAMASWMLLYNLALSSDVDLKWYYSGLICVAVVSSVIAIFTRQGADVQQKVNAEASSAVTSRSLVSLDARMLLSGLEDALNGHDVDADVRRDAVAKLQLLVDKIVATPAFDMRNNQALENTISKSVGQIQSRIADIQPASAKEDVEKVLALIKTDAASSITKLEILKK